MDEPPIVVRDPPRGGGGRFAAAFRTPMEPPTVRTALAATGFAAVAIAGVVLLPPELAGAVILVAAALYVFRRFLFNWTTLLFLLIGVIMFIPVRRYALPVPLPFALEPYRLVIVVLVVGLAVSLTIHPSFRWRPTAFGWAIGVFLGTQLLSVMVNVTDLTEASLEGAAVTNLLQLLQLAAVFFIVRQLLTSERIVSIVLLVVTWSAVVLAFFAGVERVFRVNVFLELANFLPLVLLREAGESLRGGGMRAYASSQHPIALSVLLCLIIPIALYLAKYSNWPRNEISRRLLYGFGIAALLIGILCTVSRTAFVVLAVMLVLALLFVPRLGAMLVAFALPLGLLVAAVVPRLIESTLGSLFDVENLVASQFSNPGYRGQGRLADLGPALEQAAEAPLFGRGLGSRIVVGELANSNILDNQVLGTLLDSGIVGVAGLGFLIGVSAFLLLRFALTTADRRWATLAFAIAVAVIGYGSAMFFYDAFAFMQTFMVLDILLAVGAWVLTEAPVRRPLLAAAPSAAEGPDPA